MPTATIETPSVIETVVTQEIPGDPAGNHGICGICNHMETEDDWPPSGFAVTMCGIHVTQTEWEDGKGARGGPRCPACVESAYASHVHEWKP